MRRFSSAKKLSILTLVSLRRVSGSADRFRTGTENKCATIAGRQPQQFAFCFGPTDLFGSANDFLQFSNLLTLFIDQQLRVTDNVDEQDMADFKLHV